MLKKFKRSNLFLFLVILLTTLGISLSLQQAFADFLFKSEDKGVKFGNGAMKIESGENLLWGLVKKNSNGNFMLLQDSDYDNKFKIDGAGNVTAKGNITAAGQNVCRQDGTYCPAGGGGGVTDHGALTGLSDDDHAQYLLASGGRSVTGNFTVNGYVNASTYYGDGSHLSGISGGGTTYSILSGYGLQLSGTQFGLQLCSTPGDVLKSSGSGWYCSADIVGSGGGGITVEADGYIGNEIVDVSDATLLRSASMPYKVSLNLANANTWIGKQTFSGGLTASNGLTVSGGTLSLLGDSVTDAMVSNTLTSSNLIAGSSVVSNAEVDDDITLTNITQITNRAHSNLTGLGNDEHTQYLKVDGARAMGGALSMSASGENNITAINQLIGFNDLYVKGSSAETSPIYYGASEHKFYTGGTERFSVTGSGQIKITGGSPGANKVLTSDANGLASWQTPSAGTEADGVIGNEIIDTANTTLTRSGSGTAAAPYKLSLNLANANTWTAAQTFSGGINASAVSTVGTTRIDSGGNLLNIGTINSTGRASINGQVVAQNLSVTLGGQVSMGWERLDSGWKGARTWTIDCSAGKKVIGGGCVCDGSLVYNYPSSATQWKCVSRDGSGIQAFVICAQIE
ncbi:MAG: hypothetical protein V1860_02840 [bacterium]